MKQKIIILVAILASVAGLAVLPQPASAIDCAVLPKELCEHADDNVSKTEESSIYKLLIWVLNILSALVGMVAVGMYVYAGAMYASGGGTSDRVAKAKTLITNTTIGLIAYIVMYLALNWLIPGGIFS